MRCIFYLRGIRVQAVASCRPYTGCLFWGIERRGNREFVDLTVIGAIAAE